MTAKEQRTAIKFVGWRGTVKRGRDNISQVNNRNNISHVNVFHQLLF